MEARLLLILLPPNQAPKSLGPVGSDSIENPRCGCITCISVEPAPTGPLVTVVGLLFWVLVLGAAVGAYRLTCEIGDV